MHDLQFLIKKNDTETLAKFEEIISLYTPKPTISKINHSDKYEIVIVTTETQELKNALYFSFAKHNIRSTDIE